MGNSRSRKPRNGWSLTRPPNQLPFSNSYQQVSRYDAWVHLTPLRTDACHCQKGFPASLALDVFVHSSARLIGFMPVHLPDEQGSSDLEATDAEVPIIRQAGMDARDPTACISTTCKIPRLAFISTKHLKLLSICHRPPR